MCTEESKTAMSTLSSWVPYTAECDFSIQNLPYGVFSRAGADASSRACGVAIGDQIVDLGALAASGVFDDAGFDARAVFGERTLNGFMGLGRGVWRACRATLQRLLSVDEPQLRDNAELRAAVMVPMAGATMHMPAQIGDYTDFYSSREHATNVGVMFRGVDNALQPNWTSLPVGYHGRASSVVISGTDIRRPRGQLQKDRADPKQGSVYGTCRLMDFELEMAFFCGPGNELGMPIDMAHAEEHIFGMVVMNDWSARDIQKWEYVPLGPFGGKNFGTSISPWIVTLDALAPFKCATSAGTQQSHLTGEAPLAYIADPDYRSYNIDLSVGIVPEGGAEESNVGRSNFKNLYWTIKQQLVHHTVTGCDMHPGDLCGSGTISAAYGGTDDAELGAYGSMLENCWKGTREVPLADGSTRKFLKDGDNVIMRGHCQGDGFRVGFGTCEGRVIPAHPIDG